MDVKSASGKPLSKLLLIGCLLGALASCSSSDASLTGTAGSGGSGAQGGGGATASATGGTTSGTGAQAGSTNSGGASNTGGTNTAGSSPGGNNAGGSAASDSGGSGGTNTGGTNTGGASTGGTNTGGTNTGGASTGGTNTGGVSTGGTNTGGTNTGGVSTGGTSTGGVSTGGTNTGGVSTGGTNTGGASTGGTGGTCGVTGSGRIYFVTPTGLAGNDGTSFGKAMNFTTALSRVVAGETILLQSGTYTIPFTVGVSNSITFSKAGTASNPISVRAECNGRAKFDFSAGPQDWVQDSFGFSVTGSYWSFEGIDITRSPYHGAYVTGQHNTFDNCRFFENRNTGLEINKGGAYTTVINCDSYRNYDPKKLGSMADGFGPKQTQGPGNKFINCRAWENSDDGFDMFDSPEQVTLDGCWAFRNGIDIWNYGGFTGNGNGFKLGGNSTQANPKVTRCVSWGNPSKGFDQNNNTGGITIYNSTAYNNGTNFALGGTLNSGQQHDLRNNISLGASNTIANANQQNNTWNSGFSVSSADFISLDTSLATAARQPDGTLTVNDLFHLKSTSALVNRGVNVGLPYNGSAPDLGAFETP